MSCEFLFSEFLYGVSQGALSRGLAITRGNGLKAGGAHADDDLSTIQERLEEQLRILKEMYRFLLLLLLLLLLHLPHSPYVSSARRFVFRIF
eukprot:COSAG05_NODE_8362_length_710_cov_2.306056_3_plen_92_part_00